MFSSAMRLSYLFLHSDKIKKNSFGNDDYSHLTFAQTNKHRKWLEVKGDTHVQLNIKLNYC